MLFRSIVKFNLKPNKVFLFNKETEIRLGREVPMVEEVETPNEQVEEENSSPAE